MRIRITTAIVAVAIALGVGPHAAAQIDVGGSVGSTIGLSLTEPDGFATFPSTRRARTHELEIQARVTATDTPTHLSVADADSGTRRGRLGGLRRPLEAAVGRTAFQPLDSAVDPLLATFREPLANARATVRLRQRLPAGARRGPYRKRLLVTVSGGTP